MGARAVCTAVYSNRFLSVFSHSRTQTHAIGTLSSGPAHWYDNVNFRYRNGSVSYDTDASLPHVICSTVRPRCASARSKIADNQNNEIRSQHTHAVFPADNFDFKKRKKKKLFSIGDRSMWRMRTEAMKSHKSYLDSRLNAHRMFMYFFFSFFDDSVDVISSYRFIYLFSRF